MFDFGLSYSHLLVLAILAVIVVGPKDLPIVLRRFGQFMQKMRGMAREFQGHVDNAMRDAGVSDIKKDLQGLRSGINDALPPQSNVMAGPKPSIASVSSAVAAPVQTATLPNDFNTYFGDSPAGETRVAGVEFTEAKP